MKQETELSHKRSLKDGPFENIVIDLGTSWYTFHIKSFSLSVTTIFNLIPNAFVTIKWNFTKVQ